MYEKDAKDLKSIKRLLILLLVKLGASSPEIGGALGIDESVVRRLVPARKVKKFAIPYVE
ncbi:MAG TPA: hypothetical protein DCK93_11480 [Blastocatellia bacterium]|nr:hypothetical protein [Blastocatellia bacterium]